MLANLKIRKENEPHGTSSILTCPICSRKLQLQYYHEHIRNHSKMKYQCPEVNCGWMFKDFAPLQSHYYHKREGLLDVKNLSQKEDIYV